MNEFSFSFLENPSFRVQDLLTDNFLGIEKVDLIYTDPSTGELSFRRARKADSAIQYDHSFKTPEINLNELISLEKINPKWIKEDDLPYKLVSNPISELTIMDEFNVRILFFYMLNATSEKKDHFFVYLRNRANSFGIKKENKNITESEMGVFAMVLLTLVADVQKNAQSDLQKYSSVVKNLEHKKNKIQELKKEVETKNKRLHEIYRSAMEASIENIYLKTGKQVIIMDSVFERLEDEQVSLTQAIDIVTDAIKRECYINSNDLIHIYDTELIFPENSETNTVGKSMGITKVFTPEFGLTRENKIRLFLDELLQVVNQQLTIGETTKSDVVGDKLKKHMSASAIRERILKYQVLVRKILKSEPDKYQNIILYFRPITNILDEEFKQKYKKRK